MKFAIKTLMVVSAAAVLLAGCDMDRKSVKTPPPAETPDNSNNPNNPDNRINPGQ